MQFTREQAAARSARWEAALKVLAQLIGEENPHLVANVVDEGMVTAYLTLTDTRTGRIYELGDTGVGTYRNEEARVECDCDHYINWQSGDCA